MMRCDPGKKLHFNDVQALRMDGSEVCRAKFYDLNFLSASGICRLELTIHVVEDISEHV